MKITVDVNNVKIDELNVFHKGEYNVNNLQFSFSSDYTDDLVSRAVFGINGELIDTAIINNQCIIPEKVLLHNGDVFLGVYAYNIQDGKLSLRYSPQPTKFYIFEGSYDNDFSEPEEITPSQFEQYMQALNDGLNKVEESLTKMDSATSSANDLVDDINQKLENGEFNGTNGKDGVGIASITSGQSIQQDGNTVTPVTVNKTDGTQQTFNVSAKNGIDGINGTDGNDGVTPNLQIGTVITLEPNEQATVTRTGTAEQPVFNFGIPQGQQGKQGIQGIPGEDGQPGQNGADGKDAVVNGQNTVEITTDNTITLEQQENVLNLGLNSQLIPKQNTEGTDNTFEDGLDMKLFSLGGDGKSEQETTTGKNLLPYPYTETSMSINGITFIVNEDGTVIINGTASANASLKLYGQDGEQKQIIGNYLFGGSNNVWLKAVNKNDSGYAVICTSKENSSVAIDKSTYTEGYIELIVPAGTTVNDEVIYPMMTLEPDTNYEPYTGGQPSPSPDYEQPINSIEGSVKFACRGKNLLNYDLPTDNFYYNNQGQQVPIDQQYINQKISVQPNTSYTFSFSAQYNTAYLRWLEYDKDDNLVNYQLINGYLVSGKKETIKTGNSSVSVMMSMDKSPAYFDNPQIELGTQATSYEPYVEPNQVTFDLGQEKLRSVGDVKDELVVDLDTGDYYKVENIGEEIFDGSKDENFVLYRPENTIKGFTIPLFISNPINQYLQSNYFRCKNTYYTWQGYGYFGINNTGTMWFQTDSNFSSVEEFKQWLSENNVKVYYQLATPTTVPLGTLLAEDLEKLKTFKGYNNVTVNTNLGLMNIRFTYGLDIKKYVDNKIAELSAQMIEEG